MKPTIPTSKVDVDSGRFQERPWVCLIDIDIRIVDTMKKAGYNCTTSSFGSLVNLPPYERKRLIPCHPNYSLPANLHEFDIIVVDFRNKEPILYDESKNQIGLGKKASDNFFGCEYPQGIFDPRPLAGLHYKEAFQEIQNKDSLFIIFASYSESVEYKVYELASRGTHKIHSFSESNYSFLDFMPSDNAKYGTETRIIAGTRLAEFLQKYNQEFIYETVFNRPKVWNSDIKKNVYNEHYIPIIENLAGEMISFVHINNSSVSLVFPQMKNKDEFLLELFQVYLPEAKSALFPFSTQFAWLSHEEYQLPGEAKLLKDKQLLEKEYAERISATEKTIENNRSKYKFLHDLLTKSGEELVKAVEVYFRWLGFEDVENCDETHPERKEEDLQVPFEEGLLVIEVKGLSRTSKDSECSQISKIKHRREKDRKAFDVFALYIVNHQRYLPPEIRDNPPFTKEQITDATNDERGLLTTYELFKLYFCIESRFISREDARKSLLEFGHITFSPSSSLKIGYPKEIHYNNIVGIFELDGVTIRVGDELLVYEDGNCRTIKVDNLQDNDKDIDEASSGEIGIKFSGEISSASVFWQQQKS